MKLDPDYNEGGDSRPGESAAPISLGEIWRFFNKRQHTLSQQEMQCIRDNPVSKDWSLHEWERAKHTCHVDCSELPKVASDGRAKITRRIFNDYGKIEVTFGDADDQASIVFSPYAGMLLPDNAYLIIYRQSDGTFGKIVMPKPNSNCYFLSLDNDSWELALLCDRNSVIELMSENDS